MAVVKANFVKRGRGALSRAKASLRYMVHRRDVEGNRTTRVLFGYDGKLTKEQAYEMIDQAPQGTYFYRIVLSPAPRKEDRYKDLNLQDITFHTLFTLEERLGQEVQFIATEHDDHSPNRHVHTIVFLPRRLTREDFAALREAATGEALLQRRTRDLTRNRSRRRIRYQTTSRAWRPAARPLAAYACPVCDYHQAVPASVRGMRCPSCGVRMFRERSTGLSQSRRREGGLTLSLSP